MRGGRDFDFACARFVNSRGRYFYGLFIGELENESSGEVFRGNASIYLGMKIKKAQNEFIEDSGVFDCARSSQGVTSSSDNYDGEIQDIFILPCRAGGMGEPLNGEKNPHYDPSYGN